MNAVLSHPSNRSHGHPQRTLSPVPASPSRIVFVFLDGVGLGPAVDTNPLAQTGRRLVLERLAGDAPWTDEASSVAEAQHVFHPIDATLDVDGLPQSGTGQATLLTGVNCAQVVGRHFGPFPHSKTHPILAEENVFGKVKRLATNDEAAAFANAYPPQFFEHARRRNRWTVTTRCCQVADLRIRDVDDVLRGTGLTADLTGEGWSALGYNLPRLTPRDAGTRLIDIGQAHRFTLFEYFLTDKAGHGRIDTAPADILDTVDHFLQGVLDDLNPDEELLLITSDHGNIEAGDLKTHTRHPVPLIAYGRGASHFRPATSIADITPAIIAALSSPATDG